MASCSKVQDLRTKPGEFLLEVFFNKYITKWFKGKAVTPGQYNQVQREIELLKSSSKKQKEDKWKHRVTPQAKQTEVKKISARPKKETIEELLNENEQLLRFLADLQDDNEKLKQRKEEYKANFRLELMDKDKDIEKLKTMLTNAQSEVSALRNRLSKLAGDKLMDANPDIADLSDPRRPTELGKRFSEIYDNEWSDAFEVLPVKSEEEKIRILHGVVTQAYDFCDETFEEQTLDVRNTLLKENKTVEEQRSLGKTDVSINIYNELKVLRKKLSTKTASNIAVLFAKGPELLHFLDGFGLSKEDIHTKLTKYAYRCAEICWFMMVCDPPMCLSKIKEGQPFVTEVYRPYTRSGKDFKEPVVEFHLWPALHLHLGGPLVAKGVAQPGEKISEEQQNETKE